MFQEETRCDKMHLHTERLVIPLRC